ncbi:hypothetical protein, partial [Kitasatospora xanthocidica]|uniref:hypothetical protein n=1 Tax=Kitasatospora xanthocidica TaxID=83382 RepID=UPI001E304807
MDLDLVSGDEHVGDGPYRSGGLGIVRIDKVSAATRSRLDDLIAEDAGADEESAGGGGTFFTELKADPGALGL